MATTRRARAMTALLGWAALTGSMACLAQPVFEEATPSDLPYFDTIEDEDFWISAVAPADVDADGDLDLAVIGHHVTYDVGYEDQLVILRNDGVGADGRWEFTPQPVPLGEVISGRSDLAWGDFDGDGDPDLAVGSEGDTVLYRNDAGALVATATSLPGYLEDSEYAGTYDLRSLAFGDYDNDGDLDLLIPSVFDEESFEFPTVLMRNDGPGPEGAPWAFTQVDAGLDPAMHAHAAWIDDDADGDLDLMMANIDPLLETGYVRRWRNDGGSFVGSPQLPLSIEYGIADWNDADGDGDVDVLVAGLIRENEDDYSTVLRTYRNDGAAGYTAVDHGEASVDWWDVLSAAWADYDSDGDVDLMVTGTVNEEEGITGRSTIYTNDGSGAFTRLPLQLPAPASAFGHGGAFAFLDLDGDGDLDYLVAGAYDIPDGAGLVEARMQLFRNTTPRSNLAPSAPVNLALVPMGDGFGLSWTEALDDHTPSSALTYAVELRRAGVAAQGRRVPESGPLTGTSWNFDGLEAGAYEVSLRAVDAAYAAGPAVTRTVVIGTGPAPDALFANGFE